MPDPLRARESVWVPFITQTLEADENAVLIGHSSGAAAALRIAEKHRLRGLILVAAYDSGALSRVELRRGQAAKGSTKKRSRVPAHLTPPPLAVTTSRVTVPKNPQRSLMVRVCADPPFLPFSPSISHRSW